MKLSTRLLHCVLPVLSVLTLPGCKDDEHINQLQEEIRTLSDQQGQAQSELNRLKSQMNAIGKERDAMKEERAKLEAETESLKKALDQLQKDYATYRSQYKVSMRGKAPGMSLGNLVVEEKEYRNVTVREATETLLSVIHDAGTQKFEWPVLPDAIQRLFGIEKPGEYVVINYSNVAPTSENLSMEEKIKRHDAKMLELQKKIADLQTELTTLGQAERENRKAISDGKYKGLDIVKLQTAANAYSIKRTQLEFEARQQKKIQEDLLRQDPRKKKR